MEKRVRIDGNSNGFTVVEVIVTVIIVSLFLFSFLQVYLLLESQRIGLARQANASDIAYSNLSKVTSRTGLTSADCDTNGTDLTLKGYDVYTNIEDELGSTATQTLTAYPTAGCSGTSFDENPIQVVSKVSFQINGKVTEVTHASFVQ